MGFVGSFLFSVCITFQNCFGYSFCYFVFSVQFYLINMNTYHAASWSSPSSSECRYTFWLVSVFVWCSFSKGPSTVPGGTPSGVGRPPRHPLWAAALTAPRPWPSAILWSPAGRAAASHCCLRTPQAAPCGHMDRQTDRQTITTVRRWLLMIPNTSTTICDICKLPSHNPQCQLSIT